MPSVDIVLTDAFPILSLTLVTEPLRLANRERAERAWTWRLLSARGGAVASSSGIALHTAPLDEAASDVVLLLSSYRPEAAVERRLMGWLRRRARHGAIMGCVDTGALVFAEAGLLACRPAAAHFEVLRAYRDRFGEAMFADRLFDASGDRCSSAGGVATFDMTLALIERFDGAPTAARVAEILCYRPTGHAGPQQRMLVDTSIMRLDRTLAGAVELMLGSLRSPLPIGAIAGRLGVREWTLARLFKRHLGRTPGAYYRDLRLDHARTLLANPGLRIGEVASMSGFESPEGFARAYRRRFGASASRDRRCCHANGAGLAVASRGG